jgi:16S rRNA processing protein RimM
MATDAEFVTLALVLKTQGRRGEVAAEVHSGVPERFAEGMRLFALPRADASGEAQRRELEVEDFWPHKELLVLKFRGVDSISDAELLVGSELQVPRSQRAALDPGWNYVSDLAGCMVFDHGREIGRIEDVVFGAGEAPLLIVADESGKKFDVPFAEAYLEGADLHAKQVRMRLPEGLLEINVPLTPEEKTEQVPRKQQSVKREKSRR